MNVDVAVGFDEAMEPMVFVLAPRSGSATLNFASQAPSGCAVCESTPPQVSVTMRTPPKKDPTPMATQKTDALVGGIRERTLCRICRD